MQILILYFKYYRLVCFLTLQIMSGTITTEIQSMYWTRISGVPLHRYCPSFFSLVIHLSIDPDLISSHSTVLQFVNLKTIPAVNRSIDCLCMFPMVNLTLIVNICCIQSKFVFVWKVVWKSWENMMLESEKMTLWQHSLKAWGTCLILS